MYAEKPRVYQVHDTYALFEIGDVGGDPIIAKVQLGLVSDKLAQAHKLAEMPVDFFFQFEVDQCQKPRLVCSRCGCTQERTAALEGGWLEEQRKDAPTGHLIIRCPEHVTAYALLLAGLPQQKSCAHVTDNIEHGLFVAYGAPQDGYVASAYESDDGDDIHYVLACHKGEMPPFRGESFTDIPALILAMRKIEKDLRKWKLAEA